MIIATADRQYAASCLRALDQGYDVLLEKPVAPTEAECRQVLTDARERPHHRRLSRPALHALLRELEALIDAGMIGRVISVQQRALHRRLRGRARLPLLCRADLPPRPQAPVRLRPA